MNSLTIHTIHRLHGREQSVNSLQGYCSRAYLLVLKGFIQKREQCDGIFPIYTYINNKTIFLTRVNSKKVFTLFTGNAIH